MRSPNMTSSYGDKEREFLNALEADTGRTLTQWMEAIRAEGLSERNDIIDWLRRQGFRFSRASWLERVHHNGGKAIYADRATGQPAARRAPRPSPASEPRPNPTRTATPNVLGSSVPSQPTTKNPTPPLSPETPRPAAEAYASAAPNVPPLATFSNPLAPEITALTAKAKAYRPLADFLLREVAKAVPAATFAVRGQQVVIEAGREFASLAVSARELKLAIAGGGTVSLTDARQVDAPLLSRIKAAATTAS